MNERVIDLPEAAQIDYKWVAIGETFRPEGLQRPMDESHVERIVAKWNDAAFGTPMLSYREHGNRGPRGEAFAIVSGQHRMEAARRVGKTRVTAPASVLAEMSAKGHQVLAATRTGKTLAEARAEVAARATVNA